MEKCFSYFGKIIEFVLVGRRNSVKRRRGKFMLTAHDNILPGFTRLEALDA